MVKAKITDRENQSCVYFITDGQHVKIGATKNLKNRMSSLQTSNSKRLKLLDVIPTEEPFKLESELHEKYKDKHVHGEWFDILDEFDYGNSNYLTPKEIEQILKLSHATVHKLIHSPGFPMIQIGRSIRVKESDFRNFMKLYKVVEE